MPTQTLQAARDSYKNGDAQAAYHALNQLFGNTPETLSDRSAFRDAMLLLADIIRQAFDNAELADQVAAAGQVGK